MRTLKKAINPEPDFWRKIANKIIKAIKKRTAGGMDYNDKPFKRYSRAYAERKSANKFKRQASAFASKKPNLIVTSDMLKDLKLIGFAKGFFTIGWAAFGERVLQNEKMGRAIIGPESDPLGNRLENTVVKAYDKEIGRQLDKWAATDINLTIG
jgi:hypothetical protein